MATGILTCAIVHSPYRSSFTPNSLGILCSEVWFHNPTQIPQTGVEDGVMLKTHHLMRSAGLSLTTPSLFSSPCPLSITTTNCIFVWLLSFGHWYKALVLKECWCSAAFLLPCAVQIYVAAQTCTHSIWRVLKAQHSLDHDGSDDSPVVPRDLACDKFL